MQEQTNGKRGTCELTVKEIVAISGWLTANAEGMKVSTREQRVEALQKATNVEASVSQLARIEDQLGFKNWQAPPRATTPREGPTLKEKVHALTEQVRHVAVHWHEQRRALHAEVILQRDHLTTHDQELRHVRENLEAAVELIQQQAQQIEALQRHCKLHPSAR